MSMISNLNQLCHNVRFWSDPPAKPTVSCYSSARKGKNICIHYKIKGKHDEMKKQRKH